MTDVRYGNGIGFLAKKRIRSSIWGCAVAAAGLLAGCANTPSEHAACVAPCARDMQRMQFLEDIRQSGFETTRASVLTPQNQPAVTAQSSAAKESPK